MKGKTLRGIVLEERNEDGTIRVLSGNYIEIACRGGKELMNTLIDVKITGVCESETRGEILD